MYRRIIVAFFTLFMLWAADAAATERGVLYKVSDKGHTMYLFGTMHVGLPEFFPLEKRITDAVTEASTLALEIDPARAQAEMPALMQRYAMRNPAVPVAIPPAIKPRLDAAIKRTGIDPAMASAMKPWMLAVVFSMQQVATLGYRADLGTDAYLARQAADANVKLVELESAQAQLEIFGRLTDAEQWRFLDETLVELESGKALTHTSALVKAWSSADRKGLDAINTELENDTSWGAKFTREVLNEQRNGPIADKLVALLAAENKTVAAIGALHLLGHKGVPELLRARGLTVERIY
jgi:uncharacterized protein YbaP (TraB family)